jgi:uncharacterized coiled-coil protein SlyX
MTDFEPRLAEAQRHVAEGEERVRHQKQRIEELRQDGHSTVEAERLLATLQETLQTMREHLAYEENEASRPSPVPPAPAE